MDTIDTSRNIFRNIRYNLTLFFRHPTALAVGFIFAADSFMFGTWVTLIPFVKTRLSLSDGELGLILFGMPIGLLVANPFSSKLIHKVGLVPLTLYATVVMAASFVLPLWATNQWVLFFNLFIIGIAVALMNVGINTCATHIEEKEGRKIMSTCHGMWSLGGMIGSGWSALMLKAGAFPPFYTSAQAVLLVICVWVFLRGPLQKVPELAAHDESQARFAWPVGEVLLMILIGASTSLCEGLAFDWSAVYLRDYLSAPDQVAALGFTAFSLTMMMMRFAGDALIPLYGERNLLFFTVIASTVAIVAVVLATNPLLGILGFLLLGMGVALAAPILFNAVARVPGFAPGAGLATYATFSFIGFLVGPPAIGLISEYAGMEKGFLVVALLTFSTIGCIQKLNYLRPADY